MIRTDRSGAAIEPISHIMASSDEDISVVDCPDVSSSLANEARGSTSTDGSDFTEHAEEEGLYHFRRTNYSQYYKVSLLPLSFQRDLEDFDTQV